MKPKKQKLIQEPGRCPKCGSYELEYGSSDLDDMNMGYEFYCNKCEAEGKEWYTLEYAETIVEG